LLRKYLYLKDENNRLTETHQINKNLCIYPCSAILGENGTLSLPLSKCRTSKKRM